MKYYCSKKLDYYLAKIKCKMLVKRGLKLGNIKSESVKIYYSNYFLINKPKIITL